MRKLKALGLGLALILPSVSSAETITVISDRELALLKPIVEAFEAQSDHKVNLMIPRRKVLDVLEAQGDNAKADVYLTASITNLAKMYDAGWTAPVNSDVLRQNIPANLRSQDDEWFATTIRTRNIYYRQLFPGVRNLSYEDLAEPQFEGKICIRSGTHAYNIGLFSAALQHLGTEKGEEWLRGIKRNLARSPTGNDRAQMKAVTDGFCEIAIANSYYYHLAHRNLGQRDWAQKLKVVFPEFENGGTHVNISGMAMLVSTQNIDAARKFMEFQSSEVAQKYYSEGNGEFPVNLNMDKPEVLAAWGDFTPDKISLDDIIASMGMTQLMVEKIGFNE